MLQRKVWALLGVQVALLAFVLVFLAATSLVRGEKGEESADVGLYRQRLYCTNRTVEQFLRCDTLTANECDALFRSRGFAWVSQVYGIVGTASLTGVALFHFEAAVYVRVSAVLAMTTGVFGALFVSVFRSFWADYKPCGDTFALHSTWLEKSLLAAFSLWILWGAVQLTFCSDSVTNVLLDLVPQVGSSIRDRLLRDTEENSPASRERSYYV